jgi:hypothetical protein
MVRQILAVEKTLEASSSVLHAYGRPAPAELAHWLGITTKAQREATAAVLFVQVSTLTCSLMQRIQDRFVVSAWPLASWERERSRTNQFFLQAADTTAVRYTRQRQIKHVIYAGHAWHQDERGRSTANLATTSPQ